MDNLERNLWFLFCLIVKFKVMKYLRLIPILLLGALLSACSITAQLYEAQEYDKVIQRLAPGICAGDINAKRINYVAASYHKANQADHERIQSLKATGQPDVWPEIYQRYCSMKGRNEALACFPAKVKKDMNYVKLDLDDDMMAARSKAENYLVAKANQMLSTGSKEDAIEAMRYVEQLQYTNEKNSSLPQLRKKSILRSADCVLIDINNEDERPLLKEFVDATLHFDAGEVPDNVVIDRRIWHKSRGIQVLVVVKDIQVTPDRIDAVTFKEDKEGKTVEVTDHSQSKSVIIKGNIEYYPNYVFHTYSVPFEVKSNFKNDYTTINGDREACSAETLSRLDSHPVPVPTDESMLIDAAKKLNDLIATELRN